MLDFKIKQNFHFSSFVVVVFFIHLFSPIFFPMNLNKIIQNLVHQLDFEPTYFNKMIQSSLLSSEFTLVILLIQR